VNQIVSGLILLNKPNTELSRLIRKKNKKWYRQDSNPGYRRGCPQCSRLSTQALGRCGLLHVFNPLSHAATNMIGGLIIKYRISPARTDNRYYETILSPAVAVQTTHVLLYRISQCKIQPPVKIWRRWNYFYGRTVAGRNFFRRIFSGRKFVGGGGQIRRLGVYSTVPHNESKRAHTHYII